MNKHDLDNFECVSRNEFLTLHNKLKLDQNEYSRNFKTFTENDPKIFVIKEMSDMRLGGRLTLKCGNEGLIFILGNFSYFLNIFPNFKIKRKLREKNLENRKFRQHSS